MFLCGGRERYRLDAGKTDVHGHITAPYDLFDSIRRDNQSFALMDYNTKLEDCDSVVLVYAPTVNELGQRLNALKKWFPDRASEMSERLRLSNNGRVQIQEARVTVRDGAETPVELLGKTLPQ